MNDARPTPRQQLLAGAAIGALALAGSIGAREAGRARCEPAWGPIPGATAVGPIGFDVDPDPGPGATDPGPSGRPADAPAEPGGSARGRDRRS
ncbi:hypothetical protein [Tautonia plasticadhaerens]|uniref:Uncharacterized protein n=1 Tax=Tautonia plasticadhaerens TaxID=2527974 RepID=A0A518HCC2_9BACT|nr:hypothetical protein [Tautonia plasticadhaerens]QDV38508.1 hypothetical protein ElP_64630 [Tautonia plasticadhaerens]